MTEAQTEQRRIALATSGGICEVCGKPLIDGQPQGAHRIANTLPNRAKWGSWVIDHPMNIAITCSLACNQSCNIGNNPYKCYELIGRMVKATMQKYTQWGGDLKNERKFCTARRIH